LAQGSKSAGTMAPKQSGTVTNYNSKRGFGFISPNGGGEDVFVHWEAIQTDDRWPKLEKDMKVQFSVEWDEKGKAKAQNVTKPGGGKISCTEDTKEYGDFRYPGTVKWFRGWTGAEGGFGFITLGMEASVGADTIAEGEDIYVSREELLAENPQNPKVCGGMEVEFLVAKNGDKFCACEVTLPGGEPIGDLPERPPKEGGKSKGAKGGAKGGKAKGKGKGVQKTIWKEPTPTKGSKGSKGAKGASKGTTKGKGKGKGKKTW